MRKVYLLLASVFMLIVLPQAALAASLSLEPASGTFNKGCAVSLNVVVDTEGTQTDGTDAILIYDSSRFSAQSITNGPVYPDFPGNNIDEASGKITISGLASVSTPFSGKGNLATINFTVKDTAPTGASQIKFDFDPNDKAKTTDSNVVERSTVVDVLNSVVNGNYTIGSGSCSGGIATPAPSGISQLPQTGGRGSVGTPSATPYQYTDVPTKTLPPAGSEKLTFTIAIFGGILTVLGIFGLALL